MDDKKEAHSYEYVATQIIAEYIRSLGYDGICFNSSVGRGKVMYFFVGQTWSTVLMDMII